MLKYGRLWFKVSPGKQFRDSISKTTRAKWSGGVAQVVDYLLCQHEALSANPSPTIKEKNDNSIFIKIVKANGFKYKENTLTSRRLEIYAILQMMFKT
jgi:hypothetical protein